MNTTPPMPQNRTASPAKPPRKPFSPDMDLLNLGVRVADKIINTRNLERLRPYLNDTNATDDEERLAEKADERMKEAARATGNKALLGCIEALRLHSLERRKR